MAPGDRLAEAERKLEAARERVRRAATAIDLARAEYTAALDERSSSEDERDAARAATELVDHPVAAELPH